MMDDTLAELAAQQKTKEEKMGVCKKEIDSIAEEKMEFCRKRNDSTEDPIKQGRWNLEDLQEKKLEPENVIEELGSEDLPEMKLE